MQHKNGKLVRDRLPEIIKGNGGTVHTRVAGVEEYGQLLSAKLVEEAQEYQADGTLEELADVLEVVCAICANAGVDWSELEKAASRKLSQKGGFSKRLVLEGQVSSKPH